MCLFIAFLKAFLVLFFYLCNNAKNIKRFYPGVMIFQSGHSFGHTFGHSEIEHREYFDLHDIKTSRGDKIRTYGPSHPIRVRYQTAPHPDNSHNLSQMYISVKLKQPNKIYYRPRIIDCTSWSSRLMSRSNSRKAAFCFT